MASSKAGAFWGASASSHALSSSNLNTGGYATPWEKFVYGVTVAQKYLMENTTLGIPALIQSEGRYSSSSA